MVQSTIMSHQRKHLHILGICGTAMAAIAVLAKETGWRVTGSDAGIYPPMSDYLRQQGMDIAPFDAANLDDVPDLIVVGNALSRGNVEVEAMLERGITYTSGAQFIGDHILPGRHALVVSGTHGKTTTASLAAWVLDQAGHAPGFMIGGVPEDFGGGARLGKGDVFVLEGDEYDTAFFDKRSKFLHYHARTLILNNLEYDHADIFPDLEAVKLQFQYLLRTVPANGQVIANVDDAEVQDVLERGCWSNIVSFARKGHADADWQWQADAPDGSAFRLFFEDREVMQVQWGMIGVHHIANACAVAAATHSLGVSLPLIAGALASFAGVRRRMTLVGTAGGVRVFDDFAHHPTAIGGIVEAAKAAMNGAGRLWVIVEPRSNTMRTRIHQQRLPACFTAADEVVFVPASARHLKEEEVLDTVAVCKAIGPHARVRADVRAVIDDVCVHAQAGDDILILSNGDFDGIHQQLLDALGAVVR